MKVLYNTCFADPWIQVAKNLKENHGLIPMHWIGFQYDNSDTIVKKAFPDCNYYPRLDLWKGVFPEEIEKNWEAASIDIDFLREYASYELQAITMMDRMDTDQHSFSFRERQRLFRNNIKKWSVFLKIHKPDILIGAIVPHRAYDYPLYLICKHLGIPFLFFKNSNFLGRFVVAKDIYSITPKVAKDYEKYLISQNTNDKLTAGLATDILKEYRKVQEDYSVAEPGYMKRHVKRDRQESNVIRLILRFAKLLSQSEYREKHLGKEAYLRKGIPSYLKVKGRSIEESQMSLFAHYKRKRKGILMKKKLKKYYSAKTTTPDFNDDYVFLPLHYQPEMTSNPSGDIFADQLLCVEVLAGQLPEGYKIYVKEHPSQFYAHTAGHTSRIEEFYDDLLRYKNVRLLPLDTNPFQLTEGSKAVATITGTAGWEAMVLKKPVIIFGLSWYEDYEGVLKISDQSSAERIASFIEKFEFNENSLLSYLRAFQDSSTVAYYDMGLKPAMNQEEKECVDNLVNIVLQNIDK